MRKFLAVLIALIILSGCQFKEKTEPLEIKINSAVLTVEIAKTSGQMKKGLAGRSSLCPNCGMLFEYPDYGVRNFWMKGMNFPLDFIWIKDKEIVGLAQNVPIVNESGEVKTLSSFKAVNRVLEVTSGWISQNNVKIGDLVSELD